MSALALLRGAFAVALLGAGLHADTLIVRGDGSGDFTDIQPAINAASDGDVILLQATNFAASPVLNGKALSIVGDASSPTQVVGMQVRNLPAGRQVVLRNLKLRGQPATLFGGGPPLTVVNSAGSVIVEDSVFIGAASGVALGGVPTPGQPGLVVQNSADVIVQRSVLYGGVGLTTNNQNPFPTLEPGPGGPAIRMTASRVSLYGCTLTGGDGGADLLFGNPGQSGAPGIELIPGAPSQLWIEGGLVSAGDGADGCSDPLLGCAGGDAVAMTAGVDLVRHRAAQFVPGLGGDLSGGGQAPDGVGFTGTAQVVAGSATFAAIDSPLRAGEAGTLRLTGQPFAPAGYMLGLELGPTTVFGGVKGPFFLTPPFFGPRLLGTIPASGVLELPFVTPSVDVPGLEDGVLFVHQPIVAGAPGVQFGGASVLVHVGAAP